MAQGFYSNGLQYSFICLSPDGTINQSLTYRIDRAGDLKIIFIFIVLMMETAMKSTSTASPTKPGKVQKKEVKQFHKEVWPKVFQHVEENNPADNRKDIIDLEDTKKITTDFDEDKENVVSLVTYGDGITII